MVAHDLRAPLRSIRSFLQLYREDIESAEIEIPPESQESWRAIEESTAKHLSNHVEVAVSDNGIGIAESSRSRVLDMFDRAAPSGVDGIGAGLAIVQRVADHHGGSVASRSTEGLGTTVTVWLPRTDMALLRATGSFEAQRQEPILSASAPPGTESAGDEAPLPTARRDDAGG